MKYLRQLDSSKQNKSCGPDYYNEFFIHAKPLVLPILERLYNKRLALVIFLLSGLKVLYCYTSTQKGASDDVNNKRGITLLSCLGKLFTRILNT